MLFRSVIRIGVGRLQVGLLGPGAALSYEDVGGASVLSTVVGLIAVHASTSAGLVTSPEDRKSVV